MRLVSVLVIVGLTTAVIFQHHLVRRRSKKMEIIKGVEYAADVKYRNGLRSSLITTRQRVYGFGELEFVGNITVGTPEQQFSVTLDTGSANFWVPGDESDKSCASKQKFESGSSSTFTKSNKTWSGKYEKGVVQGVFGTDIMKFGGLDEEQLAVPNTTFGLANHVSSVLEEDPVDGILGLAFTALATDNVVPPLINAINQNLLDEPLFTVWLQHRGSNVTTKGGLVTYGAIDTKNCGPIIAYEPLSSETFYQFKDSCLHISAVGIGNFTHTQVYEAASDTGTTLIGGPKALIDLLAKIAGATYNASEDLYFTDCGFTVPTLDFTIGSNKYPIDRANYVVEVEENVCILIIYSSESGGFGPDWILGTPFIHQYCNIFDIGQKRIGFAPSLYYIVNK